MCPDNFHAAGFENRLLFLANFHYMFAFGVVLPWKFFPSSFHEDSNVRKESDGEIGTRRLKAKIFLSDCFITRKRTCSLTEEG